MFRRLPLAGVLLAFPVLTWAAVPSTIPFQSRLVDAEGAPVAAGTAVQFSIFGVAAGGTAVWGPETHTVTPVNGVVSVFLGDGDTPDPIDPSVFAGGDRFLEISIGGETLTPRIRMSSAGYAFRAESVSAGSIDGTALANNAVTGAKIQDGSITAADLGINSVTSTQIVAGSVDSSELANNAVTLAKVASNAVDGSRIVDGSVANADLANAAVTGAKIASGTITSTNMGANSVTAAAIAANAVGSSELASNAVSAGNITDEPGAAFAFNNTDVNLTLGVATSVESRVINAPTAGFVIAIGSAAISTSQIPFINNEFFVSVNTSVANNDDNMVRWFLPGIASAGIFRNSLTAVSVTAVSAGSTTFHTVVEMDEGTSATVLDANLALIFVPTAYGTVSAALPGLEDATADDLAQR
ncbi:MAG: hypothetical protein R3B81_04350 [bacterium]